MPRRWLDGLRTVPGSTGGVFLNPGDLVFYCPVPGRPRPVRLHTLLGSCVSAILWHPALQLVGMSHAVLPDNGKHSKGQAFDGRYCDQVVDFFCHEITRAGTHPAQYLTYLVGGGSMLLQHREDISIGHRNVETLRNHLNQARFQIVAEHVGMDGHRKVEIDLATGIVTVIYDGRQIKLG